ncbi:hypothetical protein [Aureimonas ureilytica]|uniref:hypothetical protein n=1 Tax=Aureimonas ureilytica TaxID=401562 RepID=UPI000365AF91|nr:hypothetical protein [Aureimonas ureilytica]
MTVLRVLAKFAICLGMTKALDQFGMWNGASFLAGILFLALALSIDRVWGAA